MTLNTVPAGSPKTAIRPCAISIGGMRFLPPRRTAFSTVAWDLRLQKTHPNKEEFRSALPVGVEEGQQSDAHWPATHGVRVGRPAMARLTSNQTSIHRIWRQ